MFNSQKEVIPEWIWYFIRQPYFLQKATRYLQVQLANKEYLRSFC